MLDFTSTPIGVTSRSAQLEEGCQVPDLQPICKAAQKARANACAVAATVELRDETLDDCTIPHFCKPQTPSYEISHCSTPHLSPILDDYKDLFQTSPGYMNLAQHFIPTSGPPVKVPPRRILANYRAEVEKQLQVMLEERIIERSSPWVAPAVFTRKKMVTFDSA